MIEKTENKPKRGRDWPIFKIEIHWNVATGVGGVAWGKDHVGGGGGGRRRRNKLPCRRNVRKQAFVVRPKLFSSWEVVEAQLVERSLPIPEVCGSSPVIGKILLISNICILSTVY